MNPSKIRKTVLFAMLQIIKYIVTNLTKEMKDRNYISLKKEIVENILLYENLKI